jgi:hypothetical protein
MRPSYGAASGFVKLGPTRGRLSCGVPLLALLVLLLLPDAVTAQGLPSYRPINPVATSRSSVSFEPFHTPRPGRWVADLGIEYASTIEYNLLPQAAFFLDSELLRVRTTVTRDLGARTFLLGEAELLGAYAGVLDGFLKWYHRLLGIDIPERERRPTNDFLYAADLVGRGPVIREPDDLFLGDLRLGVGVLVHPAVQTVAAVTLPTSTGPDGYGRGVVSASLLNTIHLIPSPRLTFEGSLSAGYTPTHGTLARWQRETFLAGSAGMRWRFWGRQSLYGHLLLHSPYYRDAGLPALDNRDLSFDFGWMLAVAGGREFRVGMTEDLEPGGPAVDLVFRIGGKL